MRAVRLLLLIMLLFAGQGAAVALSIEAEIDRSEVAFGESLTLVVSLTQQLGSGRSHSLGLPRIGSIPNFDIVSTRSSQSSSFVNGVGTARTQVIYELVPQQPGDFEIPSFSFADSEGKTHATKALKVKVLPPPAQKEDSPVAAKEPPTSAHLSESSGFFKVVLVLGLLFAALVAPVMILSSLTGSGRTRPRAAQTESEIIVDAQIVSESDEQPDLRQQVRQSVDFNAELEKLKRELPEVNRDFYQKYFELFSRAALASNLALDASMTPTEMLARASELCRNEAGRQACRRLGADIEMTLYANRLPSRSFAAIDADARDVINAII